MKNGGRKRHACGSASENLLLIQRQKIEKKYNKYIESSHKFLQQTGIKMDIVSFKEYCFLSGIRLDSPSKGKGSDECQLGESKCNVNGKEINNSSIGVKGTTNSGKFTPIYVEENEETWSRVVSNAKVMRRNVLQLSREVIKKCLSGPVNSIALYDSDKDISENCVVKVRNDDEGEKYLTTCWYEFAKQEKLKKGDILHFCIRYPSADEILVYVELEKKRH